MTNILNLQDIRKSYNVGTPDGAAGPKTAKALREFQQAQGLPATGKLDTATAGALSR